MALTEPPHEDSLVVMGSSPAYAATTWGPYFNAMTGAPRRTHWYARWRTTQHNSDRAVALWRQREALRASYEQFHGDDRGRWPDEHPGVVLDGVDALAYPACLRCHWLHAQAVDVRDPARVVLAQQRASEHQQAKSAGAAQSDA